MNVDERTRSARALADLNAGAVIATVQIAAPAERVFKAITDPKELVHWWGSPDTYRPHNWESDLRVGGKWRVDGKGADGTPYSVWGEFLEIVPPRKLVQSWRHDWDQDHPETTVTFLLDDVPAGTRVTVRHEGFGSRTQACDAHARGWERVLTWLQGYLERLDMPGL